MLLYSDIFFILILLEMLLRIVTFHAALSSIIRNIKLTGSMNGKLPVKLKFNLFVKAVLRPSYYSKSYNVWQQVWGKVF
jgi:hypothetical protein